MPLPAHFQRYDALLDVLVEELVREVMMTGPQNESAPGVTTSEGANQLQPHEHQRRGAPHADTSVKRDIRAT